MRTKTYFLFFSLFLISCSLFAQTIIEDKSYVSGTWTNSGSPYIIEGEAIVAIGKTLKIKPGVIVQFKTGEERDYFSSSFGAGFLRVNGTLIAKGKANKMILFTRKEVHGKWGVIQINDQTDKSELSYCKVEHSHYIRNIMMDENATGAISVYKSSPEIRNCVIANNFGPELIAKKSSAPLIKNNTVVWNKYGIECNSQSKPKIENTIIWQNETAFYVNGNSAPKVIYSLINENISNFGLSDDRTNVIGRNPLFESEENGNYKLKKNSPCKGKASDNKNIGAF